MFQWRQRKSNKVRDHGETQHDKTKNDWKARKQIDVTRTTVARQQHSSQIQVARLESRKLQPPSTGRRMLPYHGGRGKGREP